MCLVYKFYGGMKMVGQGNNLLVPYSDTFENRDIQAFWYIIPVGQKGIIGESFSFDVFPSLHVYGQVHEDVFDVKVKAFCPDNELMYEEVFRIDKTISPTKCTVDFKSNGFFHLVAKTPPLKKRPNRIIISILCSGEVRSKEILSKYHRLYGKITDFDKKPLQAFIKVFEDGFEDTGIGTWSNSDGNYEIFLPERTYNAIVAFDKTYGICTLETWGWHIIMDQDQILDYKIGTGEVYNLNAWANNGGGQSIFLSFRPMLLMPKKGLKNNTVPITNEDIQENSYTANINEKEFQVIDLSPQLALEDINVKINGVDVRIISLQSYYETISNDLSMPAYIVQVDCKDLNLIGKQTILVEYKKAKEKFNNIYDGKSMGCFQLYLNFYGLSNYI